MLPSKPVDLQAERATSFEQLNTWLNTLVAAPKVDGVSMLDGYLTAIVIGPTFDPAGEVICRPSPRAWPDRNRVR